MRKKRNRAGLLLLTVIIPGDRKDIITDNENNDQDNMMEDQIDNLPVNEDLNSDINLDLLSEPEGAADDPSNPSLYPNIDKQIDSELSATSSEKKTEGTTEGTAAGRGDDFYLKPFQALKEKIGDGFELPQDVTQENYIDKLVDAIYEHTDYSEVLPDIVHPEAYALHQYLSQGGSMDEYLAQHNSLMGIDKMSARDLVALSLKENFSWDEQKIEDTLKKMENSGYLDIEAEKIRSSYKQSQQAALAQKAEQSQKELSMRQQQIAVEREKAMQESLGYIKNVDNIYGIPVSKAEIAEFQDDFKYLTTPDPKTGIAPAIELLQSNENLVKVLFMLKKGDDKIRQALTQAKESAKTSFMSKLDKEPKIPKRAATVDSGKINLDLLAAPEQY